MKINIKEKLTELRCNKLEVNKMSESQSRYGIMEELNKRKIEEKENLAKLERETDEQVYQAEKQIEETNHKIAEKESKYQREHKDWKRSKELELQMLTTEFKQQEENIKKDIEEKDQNYEKDFQNWKKEQLDSVRKTEEALDRYKKIQESKISQKKEVIEEVEAGVNSLKEMSSEQTKDSKGK